MNTTETKIWEYLVSHKLYPFSVLFMKEQHILKISFYLKDDIQEFLDVSGYEKMCDNFGYQTYQDNTILIFGSFLSNFLRNVGCSEVY